MSSEDTVAVLIFQTSMIKPPESKVFLPQNLIQA